MTDNSKTVEVTRPDRDAACKFADWHEGLKTPEEVYQLARAMAMHRLASTRPQTTEPKASDDAKRGDVVERIACRLRQSGLWKDKALAEELEALTTPATEDDGLVGARTCPRAKRLHSPLRYCPDCCSHPGPCELTTTEGSDVSEAGLALGLANGLQRPMQSGEF